MSDTDSDDSENKKALPQCTIVRPLKQYTKRLKRHQDAILCMYAPNHEANLMVSGSADERIRIWDMKEKTISKYISIARPTDAKLIKQGAAGNSQMDSDNGNPEVNALNQFNDPMRGVKRKVQSTFLTSFAFMGPLIFTGYEDGLICEWSIESGKLNFPMLGHSNRVNHLLSSVTHDYVWSSSNDCTVRQWDITTGQCVNIFKFADPVSVSRLQPEDDFLFTASWDKVVRVIDLEKKLVQKSFIASKETIKEMIVHDGYVYISGCDPVIRAYNFETGRPKLFTGHSGWVYCLFIHDGFLFSGGDDKVVRIWDIKSVTCVEELRAHRNGVTSVCVCGGKLYTGSFDHYIVEYDYDAMLERIEEKTFMRLEDVMSRKVETMERNKTKKKDK